MATGAVTAAGAYIEEAPGAAVQVTAAGAYVETREVAKVRVSTAGAYIEITPAVFPALELTFQLTIGGVDHTGYCEISSLIMSESEGAEIGTLAFELIDKADSLSPSAWEEVVWRISTDGGVTWERYFAGYLVLAPARRLSGGIGRLWTCRAESYVTLLHRSETVHESYVGQTPAAIVADIFAEAGITDFDVTAYVTTGSAVESFSVSQDEKIPAALNRLAELLGWAWRVDSYRALHFGPATSDPAPFDVSDGAGANYGASEPWSFPASAGTTEAGEDAIEIINKVTVIGGRKASASQTSSFTGDGATLRFQLGHRDIEDIRLVTVDGDIYSDGTIWWNTYTQKDVLTNYLEGWIEFEAAPDVGAAIEVEYTYWDFLRYTAEDTTSQTQYGRTFAYTLQDPTITTESQATAIADAILDEYAFGVVEGTLTTKWPGLRAGQAVAIDIPGLVDSDTYTIRQLTMQIVGGNTIDATIQFGGRRRSLSDIILAANKPAYDQPRVQAPQFAVTPAELGISRISSVAAVNPFPGLFWLDTS